VIETNLDIGGLPSQAFGAASSAIFEFELVSITLLAWMKHGDHLLC
jgi:hypothetical protein